MIVVGTIRGRSRAACWLLRGGWQRWRQHTDVGRRGAGLFAVGLAGVAVSACGSASAGLSSGQMRPAYASHQPIEVVHGRFACRTLSAKYHCYFPRQIRRAYAIEPLLDRGLNGAGTTIAIVDGFQDPTISADLARFDSITDLPAPPRFRTIAPFGLTPFNPKSANQVLSSAEIAIDVEWAHAIAPAANIDLYLGTSGTNAALARVEEHVISHHAADVISMSYGEAEQCERPKVRSREHAAFQAAIREGITLVAAAGDLGAAMYRCHGPRSGFMRAVGIPASDPLVTGVGGTTLHAGLQSGAYHNEVVWNEGKANGAGGGGFSSLYSRPAYQAGIDAKGSMRGVPDVSVNASDFWGDYVAWGSSGRRIRDWVFGGTSLGAPQWAGIVAIADQLAGHGLGNINPTLYSVSENADFHDITVGNNSFAGITGYRAHPGWDPASGLGSPIADQLVPALAAAASSQSR